MIKEPVVIHVTFNTEDTTVQLSGAIDLKGYGLASLQLSGFLKSWDWKKDLLFLCGDFCQESYLNSAMQPVLCSISKGFGGGGTVLDVTNPVWLKPNRERLTSVRLYVVDQNGNRKSFEGSFLKCTLVFIPRFDSK